MGSLTPVLGLAARTLILRWLKNSFFFAQICFLPQQLLGRCGAHLEWFLKSSHVCQQRRCVCAGSCYAGAAIRDWGRLCRSLNPAHCWASDPARPAGGATRGRSRTLWRGGSRCGGAAGARAGTVGIEPGLERQSPHCETTRYRYSDPPAGPEGAAK